MSSVASPKWHIFGVAWALLVVANSENVEQAKFQEDLF